MTDGSVWYEERLTVDVIDAAVVMLAEDGDDIVTSDRADLMPLVIASGRLVELTLP